VRDPIDQLQLRMSPIRLFFGSEERDDAVDVDGEERLYQR
jgi:hypothetical protein